MCWILEGFPSPFVEEPESRVLVLQPVFLSQYTVESQGEPYDHADKGIDAHDRDGRKDRDPSPTSIKFTPLVSFSANRPVAS